MLCYQYRGHLALSHLFLWERYQASIFTMSLLLWGEIKRLEKLKMKWMKVCFNHSFPTAWPSLFPPHSSSQRWGRKMSDRPDEPCTGLVVRETGFQPVCKSESWPSTSVHLCFLICQVRRLNEMISKVYFSLNIPLFYYLCALISRSM